MTFLVHPQQLLDVLALVGEAGDFVLSAEFPAHFHPVVEEAGARHHDFEPLQRDVVRALGFVVAVELLQFFV